MNCNYYSYQWELVKNNPNNTWDWSLLTSKPNIPNLISPNDDMPCNYYNNMNKNYENHWHYNLEKEKPESGDYIEINLFVEKVHSRNCHFDYYTGKKEITRYLTIEDEEIFLTQKKTFMIKIDNNCCTFCKKHYTIRSFSIRDANRKYQKRIFNRILEKDPRLYQDVINIINKY